MCSYPKCKRERCMTYLDLPLCSYHFENGNPRELKKKLEVVRRERDEKERGGT